MRIGIDIGGSHIAVAVIDKNKIIEKVEYVYESEFKKQIRRNIEKYLKETISAMLDKYEVELIGISLAGYIRENTLIISPNLPELNGINFAEALSEFSIPVQVNVDSLCAAKAERKYGCLKDYSKGMFLVIGTGIGAVSFNNKNMEVNEFGHMVIKKDGNLCRCGKHGCYETYGSMKAFKKSIEENFGITNHSGEVIRAYLRAHSDDEKVKEVINNYVENFCLGLSNIIDITMPEVIGFGGSFSYYEDILLDKIKERLEKMNLFIDKRFMPKLLMGTFQNNAGMMGATL